MVCLAGARFRILKESDSMEWMLFAEGAGTSPKLLQNEGETGMRCAILTLLGTTWTAPDNTPTTLGTYYLDSPRQHPYHTRYLLPGQPQTTPPPR